MNTTRDFANLQFRLECAQVSLYRREGNPVTVCGPGEIWQDKEGVLNFKIFVSERFSHLRQTCHESGDRTGQLRKPEDYFILSASESNGQGWSAARVWPSSWRELGRDAGLIAGSFGRLTRTIPYPLISTHWVELRLRGNLNYPATLNHERVETIDGKRISLQSLDHAARVIGDGYQLTFFHQDSHTIVQYKGSEAPPLSFSLRIQEALQFCLSSLVECVAESSVSAGSQSERITITSSRLPGGFVEGCHPPLRLQEYGTSSDFWAIFKCYYAYICGNADNEWHPLSVRVREIIASRRVSLPSEVLALAVGVEGVVSASAERLKELLSDCDCAMKVQPNDKRAKLAEAIQIIEADSRIDTNARQRILKVARSWLGEQPMDLVEPFLGLKGLPRGLMKAWKTLRHRGAHGSGTGSLPVEDTIKLRNEVLHLFYSLILAIIDYDGVYTDYSQPGWPMTGSHSPARVPADELEHE